MKKAVSILVMIIMNILMISDVKACEMSYDEYKDRKIVQSFVVGDYIFNVDNGYSPSLEDFAEAARSIKDGEEVKIYNVMVIGDIYYKVTEVFSNESTTEIKEFPKIDVQYEYRASIRGAKESDYDIITCKNKDIKIRYTGMYTEGSNEYKRKAIRYASIQSGNTIEEAKYCTTIQESCTPDKELIVKGTENLVEIEYETNASAQKICIEASDKNGSSKVECDTETVKVDKEPIKITKNQESIEIVEGKSKTLGDLFEVRYSVSGGTLQYLSNQNGEKNIINDMSELKNGEAEIEIIATSGSGIVSKETTSVEVRKNKVTYDYWTNGGTTATKEVGEVSYNGLADLGVEATKAGYTFVGWNEDATSHVGLKEKKITKDTTLYAIYKKEVTAEFIVTKNGDKIPAVSDEEKKTCTMYGNETDCTIEIPSISAKMGYKAVGWSKTERSKTAEYVGKESVKINKDEKYYSVTYEKTALSATFITYNGITPEENVLKCYKYNGESSCQIDISSLISKPYEGIPLSGYTKESETPVKEENFEISKGEEYYAYYEKESTLSYVGASKTENVKVKTWYETKREEIKVIQEEKAVPIFNDKTGYIFKGYREDLENKDAEITGGKQGRASDSTYNGIYEKEIKLTYKAKENENNVPSATTAKIYYNAGSKKEKEAEIKLDDGLKITKKNHIFESWNIGGTKYQAGSIVKITKDTEASAEWTINGSRIILDYQENGGIRADKSSIVYYQGDEEINLKEIRAYKPGWEFVGWSLYADSTGTTMDGYIPEEDAKEVRFYAIYKKTIAINYKIRDENAYVLASAKQERYTMYNKATTAEVTLANVTKVGKNYTFLGWTEDENSHEGKYNEGEKVRLSQNTTMYAVIRNDDAVKVTYNYYDGTTRKKVEKSCYKYNGEQKCETESGISKVKTDGGILVGWSESPDTIKIEAKQQNSQSKAYYGVYDKLITIKYQSGVAGGVTSSEIYKDKILTNTTGKTNLGVEIELDTPDAINGYVTDGWRTDSSAQAKELNSGENIKVYENQTYNGVYRKDISLNYNENGGKEKVTSATKRVYYNTLETSTNKYVNITVSGTTSLEGNRLVGWEINGKTYQNGNTISINKTTEAVAVWKANIYNITYDYSTNGGTSVTNHVTEETYGKNIDLTPRGIKTGYTFVGWNEDKNATEGKNEIKMPSHDITLYAVYKKEVKAKWILVDPSAGENKLSETTCNKYNNDTTCKIETGIVIPRSDYQMEGWDTVQGGTTVVAINNYYYDIANDQTFYSITRKKKQLIGTFYYGNESTIDVLTSSCILYNGVNECTVTVPLAPYIYKDTAFSEWSSNKYTATSANMRISENTSYYAHYVRSVYLNYHTGEDNTLITHTNTVEYITSDVGDHETIPKYKIPKPNEIKSYTGLGWRTDNLRTESDSSYNINTVINLKNSLDLNSVYKRTISLSYDVGGGTPQPGTETTTQYYNSISGASNHQYVLPDNITKRGYTLKGWAEGSLSGTTYPLAYSYYLNKTTTMYAVWQVNSYGVKVTGSNVTISPTSLNINYDGTGTIKITPAANYHVESASCTNGYTITGLSTGQGATGSQTVTINNNSNIDGSVCTINTKINSYGVTVSGSNVTINPGTLNIDYGGTGTVTITPAANYHIESASCTNGYTISGLSTGASATGAQTVTLNNNSKAQGSSCTINTKINSYSVTFGGDNVTILPSSLNINYGGTGTVTITPADNYYIESASCTNGYTISGLSTGTDAIKAQTVTISNNNNANTSTCTIKTAELCPYKVGDTIDFYYTGGIQEFTAFRGGTFQLEVWGAEGGTSVVGGLNSIYSGTPGKGGYSKGSQNLTTGQTIYIVVGGSGNKHGYNGGGNGYNTPWGGGATHIGTQNKTLAKYGNTSGLYIVAGGGGGAGYGSPDSLANQGVLGMSLHGGDGGGSSGTAGYGWHYAGSQHNAGDGGTQSSGGAAPNGNDWGTFGQGGSAEVGRNRSGGGGGLYGGGAGGTDSDWFGGAGGGSGYIGGVTDGTMESGVRSGDGFARITVISLS